MRDMRDKYFRIVVGGLFKPPLIPENKNENKNKLFAYISFVLLCSILYWACSSTSFWISLIVCWNELVSSVLLSFSSAWIVFYSSILYLYWPWRASNNFSSISLVLFSPAISSLSGWVSFKKLSSWCLEVLKFMRVDLRSFQNLEVLSKVCLLVSAFFSSFRCLLYFFFIFLKSSSELQSYWFSSETKVLSSKSVAWVIF